MRTAYGVIRIRSGLVQLGLGIILSLAACPPATGQMVKRPFMVKDIDPGSTGSLPFMLTDVNGTLFFFEGISSKALWKSNGTADSTIQVKNARRWHNEYMCVVNGTVFFTAEDDVYGRELWKSDGTAAGTGMVKDISPGSADSFIYDLTSMGGKVYFKVSLEDGKQVLWKSDGTDSGTVAIKTINPDNSSHNAWSSMIAANGNLFFKADSSGYGLELWKSDGTDAGTVMVKDIYPGTTGALFIRQYPMNRFSSFFPAIALNGTLYFSAQSNATSGFQLWKSDGTDAGTVLVKDLYPEGTCADINCLTVMDGLLYFAAAPYPGGYELWKSDGTTAGTVRVKPTTPPVYIYRPNNFNRFLPGFTVVNGVLYFARGADPCELWRSDGTASGTYIFMNPSDYSAPSEMTSCDGYLYFTMAGPDGKQYLYKSDGTEAGTVKMEQPAPDGSTLNPRFLTVAGDRLFFSASRSDTGRELWSVGEFPVPVDLSRFSAE